MYTAKDSISMSIFKKIKTYDDFKSVWSKYYANEIKLPLYGCNFVNDEDDYTFEMGKKCQKIIKSGIIITDFIPNNISKGNRGSFMGFLPNQYAKKLSNNINRHPGYVAFFQDIEDKYGVNGLVVSYDPTDEESILSSKTLKHHGDPYGNYGYQGEETLDMIKDWLSENSQDIINKHSFKQLTVIDTIPIGKSDKILDVILLEMLKI